MSIYSILHVSDVHFGAGKLGAQPLVTSRLVDAAHNHVEKNGGLPPDVCIFSGDLAHSGTLEQLREGENWLKSLTAKWSCKTFIVPGNHDVARPRSTSTHRSARIIRSAFRTQKDYENYRKDLGKAPLMKDFFRWVTDKETKRSLSVISDWSQSTFGCKYSDRLKGIDVALLGLNSALLSCGDDDLGRLVVDETRLNEMLTGINPEEQLVIVVTHHPVGRSRLPKGTSKKPWLAPWNSACIEERFLQKGGAHIYLHGHLHHASGTSVSFSHGQNLSILAAGASYDHISFPQQFAFYDVDMAGGVIKPSVYSYRGGEWLLDTEQSCATKSVLPRPGGLTEESAVAKFAGLRDLTKEVVCSYQRLGQELRTRVPRFAPELTYLLSQRIRKELRENQHQGTGFNILIEDIDQELGQPGVHNDVRAELGTVREMIESKDLKSAITHLQRSSHLQAHRGLLMTALVVSEDPRHWKEAEEGLPALGRPWHYVTLSYNAWSIGDLHKALHLAEHATESFENERNTTGLNKDPIHKLWNNLAYYYAEEGNESNRDEALKYSHSAIAALKAESDCDMTQYANYLDTRGFVKIVFAKSGRELYSGIKDCEDARRKGGDVQLYFRHIADAESRHDEILPTA